MGRVELTRDGTAVLSRRRKELALLVYLTRRGPRPVDRAVLASLLWGARGDDSKAKVSLRQALFDLRETLGEIVQTDPTTARVNPQHIDLDIASFEAAVASGRLADAAALWHGPFMDGLEDLGGEDWVTWVESERTTLNAKFGVALAQLADAAEAGGDRPAALRWAERCLEALPHDEAAAIRLVTLYLRAGRTADATGTAAGFADRLRRDLDTRPSPTLTRLMSDDGRSPASLGRPGYRGLVSPDLIGRDHALSMLTRAWAAAGGAGRAVLIEGDEGCGKSRLVEVFAGQLSALSERPQVFLGRAFPTERDQAWSTLRPLLARVFAAGRGIAAAPPGALASAAAVVPELLERFPAIGAPEAGHPAGPAIIRILAEMVAEKPLALLIDDAPAADAKSAAVLAELLRRPPPGLLLVLAGSRDAWAQSPFATELLESPNVADRVGVGPISVAEAGALIGSMAPFDPAGRATLAERLHRETGGNPGQLVRFVQQLADEGRIAPRQDGIWVVANAEQPIPLEAGVRDLMRTRMAELTEPARRLLEAAAVLGPTIEPRLLETVSRLNPAAYRGTLGTVLTRRLLRESATRVGQFEFSSEANRRAVYDQIVPSARARIHHEAGNALRRHQTATGSVKEEVARHRQLAGPRRTRLTWRVVGLSVIAAVVGVTIVRTQRAARVAAGTPVLVATFKNATGETDFDGSLQTAAEIGLQESGHVWLLSKYRITDALSRGGHASPDTIVDGALALEVAVRENVPVVIELGLAKPGNEYLLTGKIVRTSTGSDLRSFQARMKNRDQVLDGLSGVVADIRRALGEADSLRRPATELPALTTRSILALKLYADGEAAWNRRDWTLAWSQLQRAVLLDSTFAMAHVLLAREAVIRKNDRPMAIEHLAAARRWSGHLTGREQLVLEIEEAMMRGDARRASEITELLAARFPSPVSLANFASGLFRSNRCAEAVPVYRRVVGMAPRMTASWINLATCYQSLDSLPAALAAYAEAERVDSTVLIRDNLNQEWGRVFVRMGRLAAADSAFRRMLPQPDRANQARGRRSLGYLAMSRGDYRGALDIFGEAGDAFEAVGNFLAAARTETLAAQAAANLGDETEARARLAKAAVLLRDVKLEPVFHLYLGMTHLGIGDLPGAQAWLARLDRVVGPGGQTDTTIRNLLEARIAIASGKFILAQALLPGRVPAAVSYLEPLALETRGRVHRGLGRPDSALAAWRRAQAIFTWGTEAQDSWERLPLSIAEAALATGDSASARRALSEMLERWKAAPNDFPDLRRARERSRNLQAAIAR